MKNSGVQHQSLSFRLLMVVLGVLSFIGVLTVMWFFNLLNVRSAEREGNCAAYLSTPISTEITANLCEHGLIPINISDCGLASVELYNGDVESILKANIDVSVSTYAEVTEIFGQYATYCSDENAKLNNAQFSCKYDVSGVGPRIDVFYDSHTEKVVSIKTPSCSGS
jgi:hypothetical protein